MRKGVKTTKKFQNFFGKSKKGHLFCPVFDFYFAQAFIINEYFYIFYTFKL